MKDAMTLTEWHAELQRLAEQCDWPVCDDPETYRDAWSDETTPADYLEMEMSYGPSDDIYGGNGAI